MECEVHYHIHNCHLSLSWATWIQSLALHPTSWRSVLILSSYLCLGLPSGLFPSGFPTKTLNTPLLFPIRAICPAHLILLDLITRTILGEKYTSLSSSLCSFLHSPVTSSLSKSKYSCSTPYILCVLYMKRLKWRHNSKVVLSVPSPKLFYWFQLQTCYYWGLKIVGCNSVWLHQYSRWFRRSPNQSLYLEQRDQPRGLVVRAPDY